MKTKSEAEFIEALDVYTTELIVNTPGVKVEPSDGEVRAYTDVVRLFNQASASSPVSVEWIDEQVAEACANRMRAESPDDDHPIGLMPFYSGRIEALRAVRALLTGQAEECT